MREVDPGHEYFLDSYDGGEPVRLTFVKREGEGYPFNVGHHPGTNLQETWRADIKRLLYLQTQQPCGENAIVINKLRECIWQLEIRAARRHERQLPPFRVDIEEMPTCVGCGHIGCEGNHKEHCTTTPAVNEEVERLRDALHDANELCRSVLSIAQRQGIQTNWEAFENQLSASLVMQHEALQSPTRPQAGGEERG